MKKYRIITLDVWGNEADGFEVNDLRDTGEVIEISKYDSDSDILDKLEVVGTFPVGKFVVQHDFEEIEIFWRENERPEILLRPVEMEL